MRYVTVAMAQKQATASPLSMVVTECAMEDVSRSLRVNSKGTTRCDCGVVRKSAARGVELCAIFRGDAASVTANIYRVWPVDQVVSHLHVEETQSTPRTNDSRAATSFPSTTCCMAVDEVNVLQGEASTCTHHEVLR